MALALLSALALRDAPACFEFDYVDAVAVADVVADILSRSLYFYRRLPRKRSFQITLRAWRFISVREASEDVEPIVKKDDPESVEEKEPTEDPSMS